MMKNSKNDSEYESMSAEQLKVELLKTELYLMQFSLEVEKESYMREKANTERIESADAFRRKRERRKREILLGLKNKTSETKREESNGSPA